MESPYNVIVTYLNNDPTTHETVTILSHDEFHLYEDFDAAYKDWGSIMPPKEKIDNLKNRFNLIDIYVEISLYDSHNCKIASTTFKWEER